MFFESAIEDIPLLSAEEKVAFLDARRERFRESLSDEALWSPLLDLGQRGTPTIQAS
jgi:hypothetical protein